MTEAMPWASQEPPPEDPAEPTSNAEPAAALRRIKLTPASSFRVRPVRWLWRDRMVLGTLALLGGREGIGKSTVAYTLAADITRGRLPGQYDETPKSVIVAATEDSWEHTIVPRLMAARADLTKVFRVDVITYDDTVVDLILPRDIRSLEDAVHDVDAALILLDPLMSRLDSRLDTHKDQQVRQALEPLVRVADDSGAAILGIIHVNKSTTTDALTMLMASRAFSAVARSVLFCMVDPDDENTRLLGTPKNNLGRTDLPTLTFRIDSAHVADTDEGPVWTGRINWLGETDRTIQAALTSASEPAEARSATKEAADWLRDHLTANGGTDDSANIKKAGAAAGHSQDALKRARRDHVKAEVESTGFPRRTYWTLPGTQPPASAAVSASTGESEKPAPTAPTAPTEAQSAQSEQSYDPPREHLPLEGIPT